jgi:1,2-diacylglycerol 3-alpha-glucosyltransferase
VAEKIVFLCGQVLDPYHLARFRAFRRLWPDMEVVLLPAEGEDRPWRAQEAPDLPIHKASAGGLPAEGSRGAAMANVFTYLRHVRPAAVVAAGYRQAMRRCVRQASEEGAVTVLHLATTYAAKPRRFWREWPKRWVLRGFDAVAAVGERSAHYAESLGVPPDRIWRVGNVVDNEHFWAGAAAAREEAPRLRRELGLPERFFLCVGRLAPEKNLGMLLASFASYRQAGGTWHLVVVGSGPEEARLRELAERLAPGAVHLPGWKPYGELPAYYGLASCFVLPSLSETWGLVVNEAMASGLPVLVARSCGCLPELCRPGVNGYDFDARRPEELARLLTRVSAAAVDLKAMGGASRRIIASFTPDTWARGLADCVVATLERAHGRS